MVTRIKYFETTPLSYIVVTPYFYFIILRFMCTVGTPNVFELLNSLGQMFFIFSFYAKIEIFSITLGAKTM